MPPRHCEPAGQWKVSRYTTRVDLPQAETTLVYGGLAGRLIEVPNRCRDELDVLLHDPNSERAPQDSKLRKLLCDQGILVPREWNELDLLMDRYMRTRSLRSERLGLTICPTLACNFRCSYCFEHHTPSLMSTRIQNRLVDLVQVHRPTITALSVTWFGGEPLVALKVIERLSKRFMGLRGGKVNYQAAIVTNGWLLTSTVSRALADLGVRHVQVTLDGAPESHDRRRSLRGGGGTFDRIVGNIANADLRLQIAVRVNIDQDNADNVRPLFHRLDEAGLRGRVRIYFAPVYPYTEICADTAGSCILGKPWAGLQKRLHFEALEHGFAQFSPPPSLSHHCVADSSQGIVVDPNGLVFKCWNDVTQRDQAIFDLSSNRQTAPMQEVFEKWRDWNPFEFPKCVSCKVLPNCLGGCPYVGLRKGIGAVSGVCSELKYNLGGTLATNYLAYKNREVAEQMVSQLRGLVPEMAKTSRRVDFDKS